MKLWLEIFKKIIRRVRPFIHLSSYGQHIKGVALQGFNQEFFPILARLRLKDWVWDLLHVKWILSYWVALQNKCFAIFSFSNWFYKMFVIKYQLIVLRSALIVDNYVMVLPCYYQCTGCFETIVDFGRNYWYMGDCIVVYKGEN